MTDDVIVSSNHQHPTYEEVTAIARSAAVWSHLCGCVIVLAVMFAEQFDLRTIGTMAIEMVLLATVPLIIAAIVSEFVTSFLLQSTLPIPLFVRTCVITVEVALFSWILVLVAQSHSAGS